MKKLKKYELINISSGSSLNKGLCTIMCILTSLYCFSNKQSNTQISAKNVKIPQKHKRIKIIKEASDGYDEAVETFYLKRNLLNKI